MRIRNALHGWLLPVRMEQDAGVKSRSTEERAACLALGIYVQASYENERDLALADDRCLWSQFAASVQAFV